MVSKLKHLWFYEIFKLSLATFFLENRHVYKAYYRSQNSLGCLYLQMCNENFSTFFLEMSVFRPKVNRKSLWTRDHYVTNVRRMFAWSKTSHSLKKILTLVANHLQKLWGLWFYFYFPEQENVIRFLIFFFFFFKAGRFYWYPNDVYLGFAMLMHSMSRVLP